MEENNYTVIHLHDDTSNCNGYADSCTKFDEYIKLAKKCNMKAIAFTNHGGIYDWVKKKMYCDKNNIKYIHAVELYTCHKLEDNHRGYHICLYAKNWEGVKEINTLMSMATSKGINKDNTDRHFYYNPRISFDELMNTSDNIIVATACLASALWKLSDKEIIKSENGVEKYRNNIKIRNSLLKWLSDNNNRCFLEIQYHNCKHQIEYNNMLYKWSLEYNIPLIVGTDTHSSTKYKAECRKVLQIAKDSFYGEEDEFDLIWKTYDELVYKFEEQNALPKEVYMEAINNTNKLSDMVESFDLDRSFKYPTLYGDDSDNIWKRFILNKLKEKIEIGAIDKNRLLEYKNSIYEEFNAMAKQGMSSFMMFMGELATWCRENNIPFSPCRGSVGGSLIAYITNITDVDPLVWNTVFSRFCNADRISLADIDMDFAPDDRKKVYQYIINRFGNKNVSYILTFSTVQDRGSIDVLAKGLGYKDLKKVEYIKNQFDDIFDKYSKIIQEEVNLEELEGAKSKSPSFDDHELYLKTINNKSKREEIRYYKDLWDKLRGENKDLFYYFDGLKGVIMAKGNHPAGMIGSPITLFDNLGVHYKNGDENFPISSCSMKMVDFLNYVKFDILGLKTIGILRDVYTYTNRKWDMAHELNWKDNNVWEDMIKSNVGVFQFEGDYAHELLAKFIPTSINDMSLVNASLRPSGKSYRDRLLVREFNNNPSKEIDNLLKANYGYLVFQEDTIKFLTDICGFSGSLADTTRRAIGKKDIDLLNEQLPKILEGYCNVSSKPRSIAEKEAQEFIQIISDSSEYQFGLNHSTGYSMNGYMMAYNRYYYPLEFATAYLNRAENKDDINNGMKFVKEKGFNVQQPKFGYSKGEYFFNKDTNTIYKGIGSIKGLGIKDGEELYSLSQAKKYTNFLELLYDIKTKTSVDEGKLKTLIKLDFFFDFGGSEYLLNVLEINNQLGSIKIIKKENLNKLGISIDAARKYSEKETEKQFSVINNKGLIDYKIKNIENKPTPLKQKLQAEVEFLGYPDVVVKDIEENIYFILKIDEFKNKKSRTYYTTAYCIKTGKEKRYRITNYLTYMDYPFKEGDIIRITDEDKKPKKKNIGTKEKPKWVNVEGEFNNMMDWWEIY